MTNTPKTIQIFLPQGDPQGIRIAEITTRIVQVIEVPRSLLDTFYEMPESGQFGVYFLFSREDESDPRVYIGQTNDLVRRFKAHHKEKDFWERALVIISRANTITQSHATHMEWLSINACRDAGRYANDNGTAGSKLHMPASMEADCLDIFETARVLLATLGYPIFEPLVQSTGERQQDGVFICTSSGANGRGQYTTEGFVVLKGSIARRDLTPSGFGSTPERLRNKLVDAGVVVESEEGLVFQRDHLFGSPSAAATVMIGKSANGWVEWKNTEGQTLDEVVRQPEVDTAD